MNVKQILLCLALVFMIPSAWAGSPPAERPVAKVLDREIFRGDLEPDAKTLENLKKSTPQEKFPETLAKYRQDRLGALIWQPLKKQFMEELGIRVSDKDLDDFADAMMANEKDARAAYEKNLKEWEDELKKEGLPPGKKAELEQRIKGLRTFLSGGKEKQLKTYREIGRQIVETWKVNRELYAIFGGTVVFQQAGPEPVGAYRLYLEREEKKGSFEIYEKDMRDKFWQPYLRKQLGIPKDKVDFTTPWWLMAKPAKK